jgi:hypothetical protein
MKKILIVLALLTSLSSYSQQKDAVTSEDTPYDAGYIIYYFGIPVVLLIVVGFVAFRFVYKRKSKE